MKVRPIALFLSLLALFVGQRAGAQSADEVLQRVDQALHAADDITATSTMTITPKRGAKSERTMQLWQKGNDRRMIKFLAPASQKGIAFLSLPGENMHLYLPAFKKVRRIASHVKNTRFAGTDYSYEDLEAKRYADRWTPAITTSDPQEVVLTLTPKDGVSSDYARLELRVRTTDWYPVEILFYNKKGERVKRMTASEVKPEKGVLVARRTEMHDLKSGSVTTTTIDQLQVNTGLADDLFTERNLQR